MLQAIRNHPHGSSIRHYLGLYNTVHLPDPAGFRPGDPVAQAGCTSIQPSQTWSIFCLTIPIIPVQLWTAKSARVGPAEYLRLSPPPLSSCACCRLGSWYLRCMSLLALLVPGAPTAPVVLRDFRPWDPHPGAPSPMPMCTVISWTILATMERMTTLDGPAAGGQQNRDWRHWRRCCQD